MQLTLSCTHGWRRLRERMSQLRKLLDRLASSPRDFTWDELQSLLGKLGFVLQNGSGARASFRHSANPSQVIQLHVPHGRNPKTLLVAYVNNIARQLQEWGYYDE